MVDFSLGFWVCAESIGKAVFFVNKFQPFKSNSDYFISVNCLSQLLLYFYLLQPVLLSLWTWADIVHRCSWGWHFVCWWEIFLFEISPLVLITDCFSFCECVFQLFMKIVILFIFSFSFYFSFNSSLRDDWPWT